MEETRSREDDSAAIRAIDEAAIDDGLAKPRLVLNFAPPIEALYESETGRARSRALANRGLLGIAVYLPYLALDYLMVPDVLGLAAAIRFGVVGAGLLVYFVLLQNPPRFVRETISGAICLAAGYSQLLIMTLSQSPERARLHIAVALIVVFVAVVQRLQFAYAVGTCLLLLAGHTTAVFLLPEFKTDVGIGLFMVSSGLVFLSLYGSWSLSHEIRHTYLVELKQRRANLALAEVSLQDPLTALENRRALDAVVRDLAASQSGEELAAVLIDLDHFKSFNDTSGHAAGDLVLKRIGALMRASLRRKTDHAVRFGGEEFLLILPQTNLAQAVTLAERLRQAVEDEAIPHAASPYGVVTASFGVAALPCDGPEVMGKLIESADVALYRAKNAGRNQVFPNLGLVKPGAASAPELLDERSGPT